MSIKSELENTKTHLRSARKAILGRGGEISETAGLKDLASAIYNIPADNALTYQTDEGVAYQKIVPSMAQEYAQISKLGGMTYKSKNLFSEGTVEVNATSYHAFSLEAGKTYYFSAYVTSTDTDDPTQNVINLQYKDGSQAYIYVPRNQRFKKVFTPPKDVTIMRLFSGQNFPTSAGDTSTWKDVMITTEDTDVYEPYFEGLRDTKITEIASNGENGVIDTLKISKAIQNLEGYGAGVNAENHNYIDFERKVFVQNTRRKVFDGTEQWALQSINSVGLANFIYSLGTEERGKEEAALCPQYSWDPSLIANATKEGLFVNSNGIFIRTFVYQTVEDWKSHLAELYANGNPLTVEYVLATPIETDISAYLDNMTFIEVEGGGTLTAENEHKQATPSTINYIVETAGA